MSLPTGTVTFLRTDVEGSMGLMRTIGSDWDAVNAAHLVIIRDAVERHGGVTVRTEGDALFAAFPEAGTAVRAAIDGQQALEAQAWPAGARVRVRMGLHSGEAHLAGDDYGGFDVNRAARIASVGHGGQIVISGPTRALVETSLPVDVSLRDLGRHVLKDLPVPEHLWQVDVPGLQSAFPALRVAGRASGNLPDRVTSFVGRSGDVGEIGALLDTSRLITLTGPGGIGKTSLAVEAARQLAGSMPDGAWFVGLDTITDPALVTTAIARSLGLFDGIERPAADALPAFLGGRSLVLVLDNFEQVLDAASDVSALVRASPESRFIVTSRAPLRVAGEQEYPVRSLVGGRPAEDQPDADDASIRLFVDRARAVRPGWEPGLDAPLVTEICELVDGLPLGIELAAARVSLLPIGAIRDRLAAHLPLPGSGPRDAPARQRTLEGMIEWSHDLLAADDQRLLHDLGVFEGTFDAEQAEAVVVGSDVDGSRADVLDGLITLAERSLITRDASHLDEEARLSASGIRFGVLKTVQGFAADRLTAEGRQSEVRHRHAHAYLALAEAAAPNLFTGRQPPWLDRLGRDDANLRAALRWMISTGDTEGALRFVAASWRYWLSVGRLDEGQRAVEAVFALPGSDRPTPARLGALAAAGGIAYWRSDPVATRHWYEAQIDLARRLGDTRGIADAFFNLAAAQFIDGEPERSVASAHEARRLFGELGDEVGVNRVDWGLTNITIRTEGPKAAAPKIRAILDRAVALDDTPYVAMAAGSLAWASFMIGDVTAAGPWTIRAMVGYYGFRDVASSTVSLPIGALLALELGRPGDAATILGAFEALSLRYGVRPPLALAALIKTADPFERVRAVLSPDALSEAQARGARLSLGEAMDLVGTLADPPSAG